jgi:hypothetical protein
MYNEKTRGEIRPNCSAFIRSIPVIRDQIAGQITRGRGINRYSPCVLLMLPTPSVRCGSGTFTSCTCFRLGYALLRGCRGCVGIVFRSGRLAHSARRIALFDRIRSQDANRTRAEVMTMPKVILASCIGNAYRICLTLTITIYRKEDQNKEKQRAQKTCRHITTVYLNLFNREAFAPLFAY